MRRLPVAIAALHLLVLLVALGAACSTSDATGPAIGGDAAADAVEEPVPVEPADAGGAPCKLTAKMGTGVAVCDDCLQSACCQALVACLGEPTCKGLNDCLNGCRATHGQTDAGDQCVAACAQGKNEPAERLSDALDCQFTRCGSSCK